MEGSMKNVPIYCVAKGRSGQWTALCLNFDIAVQGRDYREVHDELMAAIRFYLESLRDYSPKEQKRLLNRKAPLWLRAHYALLFFIATLLGRAIDESVHGFVEHALCPA
jgi:predicted RNase H-like HicB family nuclease